MGGVDLTDQNAAAYHLDQKSNFRIYLHIFNSLMDVACASSYIDYKIMHAKDLTLLDFKTISSAFFIEKCKSWRRAPTDDKTG